MKLMTECFLVRNNPKTEVLLGIKKRGFGAGKLIGVGGKVEPGETVRAAAIREVEEEIGVKIGGQDLETAGKIVFEFAAKPEWTQEIAIFVARQWAGEPVETDEIKPAWYELDRIPYDAMWQDAQYWIPLVVAGGVIDARITYKDDNETVDEVWINNGNE